MSGGLLGASGQYGRDDPDLAVGRASGGAEALPGQALRSHPQGSGGSASRIVTGRSVVAGSGDRPTGQQQVREAMAATHVAIISRRYPDGKVRAGPVSIG